MEKKGEKGKEHPKLIFLLFFFLLSSTSNSTCEAPKSNHFVLVHGACHGAWSWYKVSPVLKSWGHRVTALDLAASGVNPQNVLELKSISQYFKPLTQFMASLSDDERVILVGHSLGGLAISHAIEHFPRNIAVAVFVTALMPGPTFNITILNQESFRRQVPLLDSHYTYDDGSHRPPTTFVFGTRYLASYVYHLSPHQDRELARTLMRPLRLFGEEDMAEVLALSHSRYGSVSRVYVLSQEDRVMYSRFQRWMVEHNPPNHVIYVSGSDHMLMMSKPIDLCNHLNTIATHYT
ncbi:hypothetical protein VNO78_12157 [Psophocarpus tetragonolobus]|uniref:(S)-hydroxynitrile lyase n=1 Tax=Psophocarpus tetragonolobus TaxID=3891 RepID=A0AAN9SV08_PSOTE